MTDTKCRFLNHAFRLLPFDGVLLNVSINVKSNFEKYEFLQCLLELV